MLIPLLLSHLALILQLFLLQQLTRLIQAAVSIEVGLWSFTSLRWNCGAHTPGHNQSTKCWEAVTAALKGRGDVMIIRG